MFKKNTKNNEKSASQNAHEIESKALTTARTSKSYVYSLMQGALNNAKKVSKNSLQAISNLFKDTKQAIESRAGIATTELLSLKKQKQRAGEAKRRFEYDFQIESPVQKPDRLKTFSIVGIGFILETGITFALFVAEGFMDFIPALATGAAIAFINTAAAMTAGYFGGRYVTYGIDAINPTSRQKRIRRYAFCGLVFAFINIVTLHIGAARVRVTGSHSGIFDFSEVSFFATFNDYFALALITLGIIGALIGFYKGRNGLNDPRGGYAEVALNSFTAIEKTADDIYDNAVLDVEDSYNSICDEIEDFFESYETNCSSQSGAQIELSNAIENHNDNIENAIALVASTYNAEAKRLSIIKGHEVAPKEPNIAAFEALRVEHIPSNDNTDQSASDEDSISKEQLLAELTDAYRQALAAIEQAYREFLLFEPDLENLSTQL